MSATSKRIAQIILPKFNNEGKSQACLHHEYRKAFCNVFGGYTAYDVQGGWMNDDGKLFNDESIAYHIAMDDYGPIKLRGLAQAAAGEFQQECIFIVLPCGDVEFVTE